MGEVRTHAHTHAAHNTRAHACAHPYVDLNEVFQAHLHLQKSYKISKLLKIIEICEDKSNFFIIYERCDFNLNIERNTRHMYKLK